MGFDAERFENTEFVARTARVAVPALAPFFGEGEPAEWEVRGLTSAELQRAIDSAGTVKNIDAVVRAIATVSEKADAIRKALGLTKDTPGETAKRLEMMVAGSINPKVTLSQAVKLSEGYPIEFLWITTKITELTGLGFDIRKPEAASHLIPVS